MAQELRVVIPTFGRPTLLKRTLDSLAACEKPDIYRETLVVENGAQQGAEQVAAQYGFRYLHVAQANKSNALNVALADMKDSCLVYLIDDDVRLSPDVLMRYAEAARGIDGGVFWGGPMSPDYVKSPPDWLVPMLPPDAREFAERDMSRPGGYLVFLGHNWAAFAGDIRRAGNFDPRFGPGGTSGSIGQESDMQQRLLAAQVEPRFLPGARVWHHVPPERCSPDWVAHRSYRFGIMNAIARGMRPTNPLRLPLWQWRRVAQRALRYAATRFHPDQATRFRAKLGLYSEMGMARGAWILAHNRKQAGTPKLNNG